MSRLITKEEVKKHDNERDIWMVIHNEVYDVTKFLDEHPGGADSLMDYAGQDGTQGFEDVGHSDDARELMKKYKIGELPPGEHTRPDVACAQQSQTRQKDYIVCQAARPKSPKSVPKSPAAAKVERRVQTIVVPRERRPRGPPCGERRRRSAPSPPPSSNLKWALLALGAAIIIGVVIKKYAS